MPKDENDKNKHGKNQVTLTVIVGGTTTQVTANVNAPLHTIIPEALAKSGNLGQNPDEWELKDKDGNVYDSNKKIEDLGLGEGSTIYLSRKAGGGG